MKKVLFIFLLFILSFSAVKLTEAKAATGEQPITKSMLTDRSGYNGYDVHYGSWRDGSSFVNTDGDVVTEGFGFQRFHSDTYRMYADFYVKDFSYTTFEAKVSLSNTYTTGDLGKTEVIVYADNQEIYSKTFTNTTPVHSLRLPSHKDWYWYSLPDNSEYTKLNYYMIFLYLY